MTPFDILGVPGSSTKHEIRRAFRRRALELHPDRNAAPDAAEQFKRLVRAYRTAMYGEQPRTRAKTAAAPRPDRYSCGSCGDTFPFAERCPRCEVELVDGVAPSVADARVEAFMSAMEGRRIDDRAWGEQIPMPGLVAAIFLAAAGAVWSIGIAGIALLFALFAAYVVAIEGHRILRPTL